MPTAIVTGSSGFIGYHLSLELLEAGYTVVGYDNMSDYYDVSLKEARRDRLLRSERFRNVEDSVETPGALDALFKETQPEIVIHLAAQAGVRFSIEEPRSYVDSNLIGTYEILEAARNTPVKHLLMASTSSVYGANTEMPYRETDKADTQMSFYAATKKANEAMAHSYAHLYGIPITMFRFFTVYGPWGRPDMALFKFTKAILDGQPIDVYNHGNMKRDFTYVIDLVNAITLLASAVPQIGDPKGEADSLSAVAPYRVVNIGNGEPVQLTRFIEAIEAATGKKAEQNLMPMQLGDVPATWASNDLLRALTGYAPKTGVDEGVKAFVDWYRAYYQR